MRYAVQEFYIIKSFGKFHLKNWILMVEKKRYPNCREKSVMDQTARRPRNPRLQLIINNNLNNFYKQNCEEFFDKNM